MTKREHDCQRKKRFNSAKAARAEARRRGWSNDNCYHCDICGGYHLSKGKRVNVLTLLNQLEKQRNAKR